MFVFTLLLAILLNAHVARCKNNESKWSINPNEPKSARYATSRSTEQSLTTFKLSDQSKQVIVDQHNNFRRTVLPEAANMKLMTWDEELAYVSTQYSKQCIWEHNKNRKHSNFSSVGENLHLSTSTKINDDHIIGAITSWNNEKEYYTHNDHSCIPDKVCGHYTQVVWANSYKVGCGMSTCPEILVGTKYWKQATIFVCNYGPAGNFVGTKPYKSGTKCSGCGDDDGCNGGLCENSNRDVALKWTEPNRAKTTRINLLQVALLSLFICSFSYF